MKKVIIERQICIGPNFSKEEFALIKKTLESLSSLDTLAELLKVAGNKQQLKILYLLYAHNEMYACNLSEVLGITESAVSQHLRRLKDRHIIKSRKDCSAFFDRIKRIKFSDFKASFS